MRVLVIEDNQDYAEIIGHILSVKGCDVDIAPDARTGLDLIRRTAPEVVFCDIGLPGGMSGLDFAKTVRSDPSLHGIGLVSISGCTTDTDVRNAVSAGFDIALPKPVKFVDITRALESCSRANRSPPAAEAGAPAVGEVHDIGFGQIIVLRHDLAEVIVNPEVHLTSALVDVFHEHLTALLTAPFSLLVNKLHHYSYDALARWKLGTFDEMKAFAIVAYDEQSVIDSRNTGYLLPKEKLSTMRIFRDRQDALDWLLREDDSSVARR